MLAKMSSQTHKGGKQHRGTVGPNAFDVNLERAQSKGMHVWRSNMDQKTQLHSKKKKKMMMMM